MIDENCNRSRLGIGAFQEQDPSEKIMEASRRLSEARMADVAVFAPMVQWKSAPGKLARRAPPGVENDDNDFALSGQRKAMKGHRNLKYPERNPAVHRFPSLFRAAWF